MDAARARVTHLHSHTLIAAWLTLHRPKVSNHSYLQPPLHQVSANLASALRDWTKFYHDHNIHQICPEHFYTW